MKPFVAFLAGALVVAAACSEARLPIEPKSPPQAGFEFGVLQGRCPNAFTLVYLIVAEFSEGREADRNADGYACYLGTDPRTFDTHQIWTDNNVPLSQIGGCPNTFTLIHLNEIEIIDGSHGNGDANGDGLICIKSGGNGQIIIDNNHRI